MLASASRREQQLGAEARRRVNFLGAIETLIENSRLPPYSITWETLSAEIERLPEFAELEKNTSGSTASDLLYSVIEKRLERLDAIAESVGFSEADTDFRVFRERLPDLSDADSEYIYQVCHRDWTVTSTEVAKESNERNRAFLRILKLDPSLVACPSFEAAQTRFHGQKAAREVGGEAEQRAVYAQFVKWSQGRNCEPGQILEGDSDWEDIEPLLESRQTRQSEDVSV
jgi:hypothetical protein